jgi:hypothetical protein
MLSHTTLEYSASIDEDKRRKASQIMSTQSVRRDRGRDVSLRDKERQGNRDLVLRAPSLGSRHESLQSLLQVVRQ